MARCGMHMANFLMRKLKIYGRNFGKLSTNMWKTNHVVSHFQEKWRNVVMPHYVRKDRQEFTLSVPLSDNVWAKRTMYHNEISIHRIQEFTIFSQISEKNVHAKLLRCTCSTVFKWLETVILKCCEWTKYFCSKKREICPEFGNKISPPTKITLGRIGILVQYIPTVSEYLYLLIFSLQMIRS